MRQVTVCADLDVFIVPKSASAFVTQQIQGAVTKQTIKSIIVVRNGVTREITTLMVAEKFVTIVHSCAIILSVVSQLKSRAV